MTQQNNGGPVFPMQFADDSWQACMTLLDYFAIKEFTLPPHEFMEEYVVNVLGQPATGPRPGMNYKQRQAAISAWRYLCADAMLEARSLAEKPE
jgi:hypothetical protein